MLWSELCGRWSGKVSWLARVRKDESSRDS